MQVTDQFLGEGEYYTEIFDKSIIYLHHTAGGGRPDYVISGWDTDDKIDPKTNKKVPHAVATAFVIGGISTRNPKDNAFDGKIYRAFDEKHWAHHLGTTFPNNRNLNRISVGVEICNFGPLRLSKQDGNFYTYVNSIVPKDQIIELEKPFRGFTYYHAYTDKQIAATKEFILAMKAKFPKIEMKTPLLTVEGFELNDKARAGVSGVFSHSNVRSDKYDLTPQPKMIAMLKEICSPL